LLSSRRRHTRSKRDWSSDVCSSDLVTAMRTKHPRIKNILFASSALLDGENILSQKLMVILLGPHLSGLGQCCLIYPHCVELLYLAVQANSATPWLSTTTSRSMARA